MSMIPRTQENPKADRRRSGRTVTAFLIAVTTLSVSGLAYGLIRVVAPEMLASVDSAQPSGSAERFLTNDGGREGHSPKGGDDRPIGSSNPDRSRISEGRPNELFQGNKNAVLAALAARRQAQAEREGEWTPGRSAKGAPDANAAHRRRATAAPASSGSNASRLAGTDAGPTATGPTGTPFEPGYVEILGIPMRTPARDAGLRRGDKILEYNGEPVQSRLELEQAWSAPGLASEVPVVIVNRYTGEAETVYVPPGDLGAALPPRYNP